MALKFLAASTSPTPEPVQHPRSGKTGAAHALARDADGIAQTIRILARKQDNLDYRDGE